MSKPLRVVLDTNVVLSALLFRSGSSARLRRAWQDGAIRPLVSADTVQELLRVLAYPKFRLSADEQYELLADYLPHTSSVRIAHPPPRLPDCRDPHDMPFLVLAASGRAQCWSAATAICWRWRGRRHSRSSRLRNSCCACPTTTAPDIQCAVRVDGARPSRCVQD